ncbi:hypothetical protein LT493_10230 [Streptomyces tricolor]|nr:hypothetical protein [Streptomyces tricolor]
MTGVDDWTLADGTKHPTGFLGRGGRRPVRGVQGGRTRDRRRHPSAASCLTVDKASLPPRPTAARENADAIAAKLAAMSELRHPVRLKDVDLADYAAAPTPGGHGPMEDLAVDATSGRLLIDAPGRGHAAGRGLPRPGRAAGRHR